MNLFDFIERIIIFASTGAGNFFTALFFIALIGVFTISVLNVVFSNFRLFEINSKVKEKGRVNLGLNQEKTSADTINPNNIYDLLINAWEKHKKSKGN
jgi:hypothetical protein